ncbi:MAG TPA: aminotransferase class V-fold PLP-dependent enzyme [Stellaceae bacterium]|nr:aminotransferase class V-fold PLP-dependent enzyme [Stellaceae bacterium]
MLECQKHLFALDPDITYLNSASISAIPFAVEQAGAAGVAVKVKPWRRDLAAADRVVEETRQAAADLIGARADDIAIIGAVSYGIATVCANTRMAPGARILLLDGEHSSLILCWSAFARDTGAVLDFVARPADGDWTAAVLEAVERPGAPPIGIAALTPLIWSDGALVDLADIAPVLRRRGVPLLIDATQAVGVMPIDVKLLQPDFLVFPSYKWVLGPYGLAFLYVAPHRQSGRPLEEHAGNRRGVDLPGAGPVETLPFLDGARRFDRGERDSFITIPMVHAGLRLIATFGRDRIEERLRHLTDRFADRIADLPLRFPPRHARVPHIIGLRFPGTLPEGIVERMAAERIFVSLRGGGLRISPHVYNDDADLDRCADWLRGNALGR